MTKTKQRPSPPEIVTFGCRLNFYESEVMRSLAQAANTDPPADKKTIIVNTCAVTNEATRQARQSIRKLRREQPGARIVVTGCAAQIDPDMFSAMDEVDCIIGNREKTEAHALKAALEPGGSRIAVSDIMSVRETAGHLIDGFGDRVRAYVEVQNGCDHRCTFCIIPYGRGPSRSVPAGEVVDRVRHLVSGGIPEVVLSGVDMTSWGGDLPGTPQLGRLVRQLLKHVPSLKRLRLSSVDPIEIDDELIALLSSEERLMPHVHLSLQAGDNMILKRMKRRHSREDAIALTQRLKAARPQIAFGADLIAGFPTETDAMFANTEAILDDCDLTYVHVFPFSPKQGTPAARMPLVRGDVVKKRAAQLRAKAELRLSGYLRNQVGRTANILAEKPGMGRTESFAPVAIDPAILPGTLVQERLIGLEERRLIGESA